MAYMDLTHKTTLDEVAAVKKELLDLRATEEDYENALNTLRLSNYKKLQKVKEDIIFKEYDMLAQLEEDFAEKKVKQGVEISQVLAANEAVSQAQLDKKKKIAMAKEEAAKNNLSKKELKKKLKQIDTEYKEAIKKAGALAEERAEFDEKNHKKQLRQGADLYASLRKEGLKAAEARAKMAEEGMSEDDINDAIKTSNKISAVQGLDKAAKAISNYAAKLAGDINDIGESQGVIDTRLQGSKLDKKLGSYWREMSSNITENIAMSPFIKQADAVKSLKDLVGKGIAYNVEQRAFLDTISSKIADTFEATEGTLLKLVRIQQQDTTAARLGMESALTAFLNNMYETTEYMTQAADTIRQNIYEASALMRADEATAFEYQVQKWMGSLFSVGFANTEGLSAALGKLAAGDINVLNEGGYGNLLVMAANQAGISTAEILQEGLTDNETNKLMQAMVNYLGGIYNETKNSKVVAQQFANVYGLTASDLKAAANLAKSTTTIANQNLNYGGMITQLNTMADTIYQRTGTGEMMSNLFDNLNYSIASSIGSNPILYATYTIASMLDDVAGGIALPDIKVMGSGVNLQTTVADLMRVASVGGGLIGGIGKMINGLAKGSGGGFSGSGMLKAFGIDGGLTSVSRGTGAGLLTTATMDTSSSGSMAGNEDSSDIQNKTMGDAQESGDQQLAEAQDETEETKLRTVDEHIMSIYTLLDNVVSGSSSLQVRFENTFNSTPWSQ